jgi:hypothetical protein
LKIDGLSPSDASTVCVLQTGGGDEMLKDSRNEDEAGRMLLVLRDKEVLVCVRTMFCYLAWMQYSE